MPANVVSKLRQATDGTRQTAPGGARMPFRPENIMTTLLLTAVMSLVGLGILGAVAVAVWGGTDSTPVQVYIAGTVLLALKVVLGMLQAEVSRKAITHTVEQTSRVVEEKMDAESAKAEECRMDIKAAAVVAAAQAEETREAVASLKEATNGELIGAVKEAAEQARQAEREQMLKEFAASTDFLEVVTRVATEAATAAVEQFYKKASDSQLRLPRVD